MLNQSSDLGDVAAEICRTEGFRFVRMVGGGAFKRVFLIIDQESERIALKVSKASASIARSAREVDAMVRCNHAGIAKCFGVGNITYGGAAYSYTREEYLAEGSLGDRIGRSKLSTDEAYKVGQAIISALSHISKLRLIHRDIKPDNIMFRDRHYTPVLVDFGLVRDLGNVSLTQSWQHTGPGTPYYAAPEQLTNKKSMIDWRTDQFSLGVTLAVATTGLHPYQWRDEPTLHGGTVERVIRMGARDTEVLDVICREFPVIKRMTEAWPISRFRTPEELQNAWDAQRRS